MVPDPLSPIAPARVRVLLLPMGRIKRSRFLSFVERLKTENVVRLGDVSPDGRPNRTMFSPLAFPIGRIIYDLSTSLPPQSQLALSPFELYREPLVVIGIADSTELGLGYNISADDGNEDVFQGDGHSTPERRDANHLLQEMEDVREQFPKALVHQILFFDYKKCNGLSVLPDGAIAVPPPEQSKTTTIKTVMCDLSSLLLAEMTSFAKSLQALYTIDSPSSPQNAAATNGWSSWASDSPGSLSRRNSQMLPQPHGSRSGSPGGSIDRSHHRMSMPVHLPSSPLAHSRPVAGPQPTSPPSGTRTPPPTSFEQMPAVGSGGPLSNTVTRSSAAGMQREPSLERVAVQGFGSGSLSERARNKGKGRVGGVIGSLYLHAGRWGDAVREFVESATIARANSDHLWHAKALENILVGLLMLAWAGIDFQIPQICYPATEKIASKSLQQTPSSSTVDVQSARAMSAENRPISLQNLAALLPDLLNTILNLYARAANFAGESLPQLPYSETIIRFSKLMTAVHLSDGKLDDDALAHVVLNIQLHSKSKLTPSRVLISPTRVEITTMLFRALPPSTSSSLAIIDHTLILSGICSVLSALGFHRKRALVIRELISVLIPGLVQARKLGAAEMGVHPAAGLAAWNAIGGGSGGASALNLAEYDESGGLRELLGVLGNAYGVVGPILGQPNTGGINGHHPSEAAQDGRMTETSCGDSNEALVSRALSDATLRAFGNLNLKMVVLRSCINLCEALPDLRGILRFTTELLRTAGSGVAPGPRSMEVITRLSKEEQVRLTTNISRTVSAAAKFGLKDIEAEYWDDFLVRGVETVEPPSWKATVPHAKSELVAAGAITKEAEKSPFIYNPFLKKTGTATVERSLIAGEPSEFQITLQNPFDFDVEIEHLSLESGGVRFGSQKNNVIVGPYRTQTIIMEGTAWEAGSLCVTGCFVKVRNCRGRRFPVFREPWSPEKDVKIKRIGLAAAKPPTDRPISTASRTKTQQPGPKPSILELAVIKEQPVVVVKSTSLSQSAMMILEGQTSSFTITLHNLSSTTPADLLLFSFQDSTTAQLQAAMSNKDISPAELYELELLFSHKQAFRWRRDEEDGEPVIPPNQTATFEIDVLGKPGLTSAIVQVDYAFIGVPRREVTEKFYTRQVVLPITVTVNASVELVRVDTLPFPGDFGWVQREEQSLSNSSVREDRYRSYEHRETGSRRQEEETIKTLRQRLAHATDARDYCLLLLDVRNSWPHPLKIDLQVRESPPSPSTSSALSPSPSPSEIREVDDTIWANVYSTTDRLQPGHTSRIVLPLPRIFLQNPHATIPTLNPANQRQFVVSASKVSPDIERASREAFWYREEVLKLIRGFWEEEQTGRRGSIELRGIRLNPRMVEAIKVEDIGVEVFVRKGSDAAGVRQLGPSKFEVCTDELVTLTTRIHNRSTQPIYPLLRLQPSLRNQPHNIALDLSKRFAHNGLLQRPLPLLQAGKVAEDSMGVCFLCRGEFEVGVSIEETRIWEPAAGESRAEHGEGDGERGFRGSGDDGATGAVPGVRRARADTSALFMDSSVLGEKQRRIWMGRENCAITVKDRANHDGGDNADDDEDHDSGDDG